jgi:catechol 2,3-dioxygenase-like lactoylglutathione lyase family enzyme
MSEKQAPEADGMPFGGVNPILPVHDVSVSIAYYVRTLGFKLDWHVEESGFASVSRGRCHLFLCEGDQGHFGTWVWIGVEDAEAVFNEFHSKGARVRHPPTNYPWALEMQIGDPDGNVLRIGSDPKRDQPWGEWLDMRGTRWAMSPNGNWIRVEPAGARS